MQRANGEKGRFETCPYGRDDVAADAAYPVHVAPLRDVIVISARRARRTYNQTSGAKGDGAQV
jgi:hypothetical protein